MMKFSSVLGAAALCLLPAFAQAQTITTIMPGDGISFTASLDHDVLVGTGATAVPKVSGYRLELSLASAPNVATKTVALGKPTPDASKTITVKPIAEFATLADEVYVLRIIAFGPDQSAGSVVSDPLPRVGPPAAPGKPTRTARP